MYVTQVAHNSGNDIYKPGLEHFEIPFFQTQKEQLCNQVKTHFQILLKLAGT
jgi:hypothetical protein